VTTALLDVNALVALPWDPHVHRVVIRTWFARSRTVSYSHWPVGTALGSSPSIKG
jgi:uncharacterized protein